MGKKRISKEVGQQALANLDTELATAVRFLLQQIELSHPGHSVELRVPPFGAIQCIAGLNHRRGTPPNVVEMNPEIFLNLCLGELSWQQALGSGKLIVSGNLASELADLFPLEL